MSSTTRLLVLGVVKLFQPVHGYVVRRELISWRAQEWASVQPGSIYNALKSLTRDGLLEVASTDQVGGRPERTTYRLTTAGSEEFHTLLRDEWWTVRMPIDPLMAAVSFLSEISRAEAIAAFEHRAAQIHGMVRHTEFAIEAHDGTESPYHVREMMRLMNARISVELAWSERFIERLRNREYSTADDPPWQPPRPPGTEPRDARSDPALRDPPRRPGRAARGGDPALRDRAIAGSRPRVPRRGPDRDPARGDGPTDRAARRGPDRDPARNDRAPGRPSRFTRRGPDRDLARSDGAAGRPSREPAPATPEHSRRRGAARLSTETPRAPRFPRGPRRRPR